MVTNILTCLAVLLAPVVAGSVNPSDEQSIRNLVSQAINRLNGGDATAVSELWDEDADYVGVDGTLTRGRERIQALFSAMVKSGAGQERATIDQIRFITPDVATVDGSWIVAGARDANGKVLPPIRGRGFELVRKRGGQWRFVESREMVVFQPSAAK